MRYLICGTPDYFRRAGHPRTPKDLDGHNCLVHLQAGAANHWRFTEDGKDYFVRVSGNYSCNSGAALCTVPSNAASGLPAFSNMSHAIVSPAELLS